MTEHVFMGLTATDWGAIGTVVNAVVVIALARFTYRYMKSTTDLVESARVQADASLRQAEAAGRTVDLLLRERSESESYQQTTFRRSISFLIQELSKWQQAIDYDGGFVGEEECHLVPAEWDTCVAFIDRKSPHLMGEVHKIEDQLKHLTSEIEKVINAPGSGWISMTQRRRKIGAELIELRMAVQNLLARFGSQVTG
jgi:hypothetical protein